MNEILVGDALALLKQMEPGSVHSCVTSPPYWGLREYEHPDQIGAEKSPEEFVLRLCGVFSEVLRVLRSDGALWLNLGDSYAASGKGGGGKRGDRACWKEIKGRKGFRSPPPGYKMKDMVLTPFMVAKALRDQGWYLRSVVVWKKVAATEPMRLDRPAVSHEYVFLMAKSEDYATRNPGEKWWGHSVWEILQDHDAEHPASMPIELARRCIASSSRPGEIVLDPFMGSGTVALAALKMGRTFMGMELNPEYAKLAEARLWQERNQARLA